MVTRTKRARAAHEEPDDVGDNGGPAGSRARILEAARAEFSAKGLGGARVNDIALRAGVNKQLIYYYFEDKERLYARVIEQAYRDIRGREVDLDLDALDPEAAMATLIRSNFDFLVENRDFVSLINDENVHRAAHIRASDQIPALHASLTSALGRTLERGAREGCFSRTIEPMELYIAIASLCYFSLSNTHTLSAIFGTDVTTPARLAERRERAVEMILSYLRTPSAAG